MLPGSASALELPEGTFEGLIFDCDGTLADTMPLHHEAWRHALRQSGARFDFTWELFQSRAGMSLEHTVLELNRQFDHALDVERVASDQRAHYNARLEEVRPIEPVVSLARRLHLRYPMAVASGSQRGHVERTLRAIGVRELFDAVVTAEDVPLGKPHPDMFLLAAATLGVRPEACVVLEDAELGLEAARRAGMRPVWVATGARA